MRLDVDYTLAKMEKPPTVEEAQKQARNQKILERWEEAQAALRQKTDKGDGEEQSSPEPQSVDEPGQPQISEKKGHRDRMEVRKRLQAE
jgi:hypothetical protein